MRLIHELIESPRKWHDEEMTALGELLGGKGGSLPELADRFTEAGLAEIMAPWIGDGPPLPVSMTDLRRVLGNERVGDLATMTGLPSDEFLAILAHVLPSTIHRMTRKPEAEASAKTYRSKPRWGGTDAT